jgi:hypothetical protein
MICTISIPEPFMSSFEKYRPADVVDVEPNSSDGFFARGRARSELGHFAGARADFERALCDHPDACRLELAYLDLREPGKLAAVLAIARKISGETTRP